MFRVLRASTVEIDDTDEAVSEILDQLDFNELATNSVGIVGCNLDFILNGTVKALCEKLPFEVVGSTTIMSDICGTSGEDQLSLIVLTSNDVSFACGTTDSLIEDVDEPVSAAFASAASKLSGEPTMAIFFAPYLLNTSGDAQVRALDKASNNIPVFGTVALDYVDAVRDPRTIYDGISSVDRMSILLISGKVDPQFFFVAIPKNHFLKQRAIITSSEDNVLKEVNNMPAVAYLETLGLIKNGELEGIPSIPLSIDIGDGGSPVARAIFAATPEGHIICGGDMPQGAALGIGSLDSDDVITTAKDLAHRISSSEKNAGAIIFSCLSRNTALGLDSMLETETVSSILGDNTPYLLMYSAGEMYPEILEDKTLNKAHNFTMIACVF